MIDEKYKLKNSLLGMTFGDADKLISSGDGDAALLYLYLLRNGSERSSKETAEAMHISGKRVESAASRLRTLGLLSPGAKRAGPAEEMPEYTAEEVVNCSKTDSAFADILKETESLYGRPLSAAELKTIFGIYSHLGLPPEVMMLLLHYCFENCRNKYGPGRSPGMRSIEKEAFDWENNEVFSLEAAESYLSEKRRRHDETALIRQRLGTSGHQPTVTERMYIESWLNMGFRLEAVEMAMDRTVINIGSLSWRYMDGILCNWHSKGLHEPEEIEAKDPIRRTPHKAGNRTASGGPAENNSAEEMEQIRKAFEKISNSGR